ncbi:MAG: hypothetical protein H6719_07970 [Sandaracinaceae bacterium]|nr:hypothetical protein [Sandaracinaceae bacterium]
MERYRYLREYLAALPDGLSSHPECASKATLLRSSLEGHEDAEVDDLRPELLELYRNPPPATVWVPAVKVNAILHVIIDLYYPRREDVIEWARRRTLRMRDNPIYARILRVTSVYALFRISQQLDRLFQRGTHIQTHLGKGHARFELTHPPYLVSPINQVANVGMFEAMVEITGGADARCEMTGSSPTGATFEMTWTD